MKVELTGGEYSDKIDAYLTVHKLSSMKRTGWVDNGVPESETIMCHMYDAWLLAKIFLPDEMSEPGYDKDRILEMLLIHDIAESITGDIVTPKKELDPRYDLEESEAMEHLLIEIGDERLKSLWAEWDDCITINSVIAKDMDVLQMIVQYCLFRPVTPMLQTEESTSKWLGNKRRLKSSVALELYDIIVPKILSVDEVRAKKV